MAERWITKNGGRIPIDGGGGGKAIAAGVAAVMVLGSGGVTGGAGGSSVSVETVKVRKADAKRSARSEVQRSLIRNPCTSLQRALFAIADRRGNTALVSVAWVRFRTSSARRRFQEVIDVYGTGDIKPLAASVLGLAGVRFTGRYYHSIPKGARLTVAEAEAVKGAFEPKVLDGFAQIAAELPSPPAHRRR